MAFEILNDIEVPASAARTRTKGEFGTTLNALEVGQGFKFESPSKLENQYAKVAPKKFGGKQFKVWLIEENTGEDEKGRAVHTYGVKRKADKVVAAEAGADQSQDEGSAE